MSEPATPAIRLEGIAKHFGPVTAVDGVDLAIEDGEFFSMLGPSGSGKTTVLRMVAGFEAPTAGRILLGGQDVTGRPPHARDVNTVFQDYALFPHMDVQANVEYGLRVKKVPKAERRERALAALETVRLAGYAERRPGQLSGGQRQRVALARALVNRPKVLLLDEPLGALDLKLRREMQLELKQIQREVGITFVFVTHDQEEALTMSDRIAVFNEGRVQQVDTPARLYEAPATDFVAGFVGTSNLLTGASARAVLGRDGTFSIRPEKIHFGSDGEFGDEPVRARGVVAAVVYLGPVNHYLVELEGGATLTVLRQNLHGTADQALSRRGERVELAWADEHVIDLSSGGTPRGGDGAAPGPASAPAPTPMKENT
ncbi:MAG TPA: ABC transporter ATP-binding protein [Nocardioides sp.]|uniref:ABC transporter ATP-binding protein n=1 Tax=Nocardioides sp. TaxID=35761 RepID=UPI002C41770F|nr:ABC transporter ATP-binding protein [Nocardioides sp.]HQR26086.1 ABC transporter ATP-binding protein [Nocardioides sp.]